MFGHVYTKSQINWLKTNRQLLKITQLSNEFNRLFETNISEKAIAETCKRNRIKAGNNGRFNKGDVPHNKGKKGWTGEGCKATAFKTGHTPANRNPVGHERSGKDGYIQIKVAEGIRQYRQKHRVIYEQNHGEIPKGYVVIFLDGDILNFEIENLSLVKRSELAILNKREKFGNAIPEIKTALIGLVRLEQTAKIKAESKEAA